MEIRVSEDPSAAAGAWLARRIRGAARRRGEALIAVSGGSTAPPMFRALLEENVPWDRTTIWQVDERVAPDGDRGTQRRSVGAVAVPGPPDAGDRRRPGGRGATIRRRTAGALRRRPSRPGLRRSHGLVATRRSCRRQRVAVRGDRGVQRVRSDDPHPAGRERRPLASDADARRIEGTDGRSMAAARSVDPRRPGSTSRTPGCSSTPPPLATCRPPTIRSRRPDPDQRSRPVDPRGPTSSSSVGDDGCR